MVGLEISEDPRFDYGDEVYILCNYDPWCMVESFGIVTVGVKRYLVCDEHFEVWYESVGKDDPQGGLSRLRNTRLGRTLIEYAVRS